MEGRIMGPTDCLASVVGDIIDIAKHASASAARSMKPERLSNFYMKALIHFFRAGTAKADEWMDRWEAKHLLLKETSLPSLQLTRPKTPDGAGDNKLKASMCSQLIVRASMLSSVVLAAECCAVRTRFIFIPLTRFLSCLLCVGRFVTSGLARAKHEQNNEARDPHRCDDASRGLSVGLDAPTGWQTDSLPAEILRPRRSAPQ